MGSRIFIILFKSKNVFFALALDPQIQTITLENIAQQQVLEPLQLLEHLDIL